MAGKLPYYPLYVDDFDEGVLSMNMSEVGLYILALGHSWKHGSIPDDPVELARLIRRKATDVRKAWPAVKPKWIPSGDGKLTNARQEEERAKAVSKSKKASIAAEIKHANARAPVMRPHNPSRSSVCAPDMPLRNDDVSASESKVSEGGMGEGPIETIQRWLQQYVSHFGRQWPMPDHAICFNVFRALNGASLDDLEALLRDLYGKKQAPGKNYAWFVPVVTAKFEGINAA